MKHVILPMFVLALLSGGCDVSYIKKVSSALNLQNTIVAFVGVHIVPMDSERILNDQTVIVRDGIIETIGDRQEINVPDTVLIVEGQGKYLLPGLADMHVHINSEKDLLLFVAHGVTTVQNMWSYTGLPRFMGFPNQLDFRNKINRGELLGPTIYTAGPILEGKPKTHPFMTEVKTVKKAEKAVAKQQKKGYDFIKVYDNLTVDTYTAILHAAKKLGIPVKGHVPKAVGIDGVLESSQVSIEHLTGYIDPDAAAFVIPEDMLEHYAKKTQTAGVWNCPTIVVWQKLVPVEKTEEMKKHPGMQYLSGMQKFFLGKSIQAMHENIAYTGDDYTSRMAEIYYTMTKALHDAGAKLLLGTDAGNPFVFPGWSLHEELQYFVNAGLTPYEAIEAGTRNAAESLNKLDEFGTIAVGKRAVLILVEGNPLQDIANVDKRAGVMLRGLWLPEAQLTNMLKELAD